MRRKPASMILFLAAVLAAATFAGAGEHPWNDKRIYYIIELQGRLQEKGFFVRRNGSYEKQPCVVTEEERTQYAPYDDRVPVRSSRIKTITTRDGVALQRHEEVFLGDIGHQTITVAGGEALFESGGSFGGFSRMPVPAGALFEITGEWLASHSPRVGASFVVDVIDRPGRSVVSETVDIRERLSAGGSGTPSVWLAEFNSAGRPPMFARFTSDGRLTRLESSGLVYQVVSRSEYDRGRIPDLSVPGAEPGSDSWVPDVRESMYGGPSIPIGATVPAWDNFAWLILQAAPDAVWNTAIAASEYSQVEYAGPYMNITALRNAPRVDAAAVFPMQVPPDIQPYLTSNSAIPTLHPAIIEAANAAVTDGDTRRPEPNVLRAVSYLAGWVNQNIALRKWSSRSASAVDALSARSGDAAAQARIFAAMARSLGVPSRLCQGLFVLTGQAVYHSWAEVWINGSWIPVDTTVSRVGLPAGYVMAERSGADGVFKQDFAAFMRRQGLSLTLLSGGRETPAGNLAELVVGNRRSYAYAEGDWLANLYWGFALRLPPAWTGAAKLNSVEITSPDLQASVKCEALSGDFRAGQGELESNIDSLRSNLSRFRLVDSRVVSFDPDGATPALFMDFTCVQGGKNLRCRQYLVPRRQRAFRISFWAPTELFNEYSHYFDSMLASFEF